LNQIWEVQSKFNLFPLQDRPIEDIVLQKALIFVDPFAEADEQVRNLKLKLIFSWMSFPLD
jgi:hypothetical protein